MRWSIARAKGRRRAAGSIDITSILGSDERLKVSTTHAGEMDLASLAFI
jgi:hypothetical protein